MRPRVLILCLGSFCVAEALAILALLPRRTVTQTVHSGKPAGQPPEVRQTAPPPSKNFNWLSVESVDYHTYISNLRAIGCPEETVRDIITADVEKLFASRNKIVRPATPREYWQPEERQVTTIAADTQTAAAVESEKRALLQQLLGVDVYAERRKVSGEIDPSDDRLAFPLPGKASAG